MTTTTETIRLRRRVRCLRGVFFALPLLLAACGQDRDPATDGEIISEIIEVPPVVETRWTSKTELFVEYPPLG